MWRTSPGSGTSAPDAALAIPQVRSALLPGGRAAYVHAHGQSTKPADCLRTQAGAPHSPAQRRVLSAGSLVWTCPISVVSRRVAIGDGLGWCPRFQQEWTPCGIVIVPIKSGQE